MNKGSRLAIKPATDKAKADGSPRKPARVEVLRQKRQTPVSRDTQTESPDGLGRVTKKHHQEASQSAKVNTFLAGRWRGWKEIRHGDVKPDRPKA